MELFLFKIHQVNNANRQVFCSFINKHLQWLIKGATDPFSEVLVNPAIVFMNGILYLTLVLVVRGFLM